jgi:hypothetical protein
MTTIPLQYVLKSESISPPTLLFFFKADFGYLSHFHFYIYILERVCQFVLRKKTASISLMLAESVAQFENSHLNNVECSQD